MDRPSRGEGWRQQHAHKIGLSPIMPALALLLVEIIVVAAKNYIERPLW